MNLDLLYFGGARDAAGTRRERIASTATTVGELRKELVGLHPALERVLAQSRLAVDEELADDATPLRDGAEVAVIPPVAGGSGGGTFRVTDQPLDLAEVVNAVSAPGMGGVVTFSGAVRAATRGRRVLRLEYEAYQGMAERALARIGAEVGAAAGATVAVVAPRRRAPAGRPRGRHRLRRSTSPPRLPGMRDRPGAPQEGSAGVEARGVRGREHVGWARPLTSGS